MHDAELMLIEAEPKIGRFRVPGFGFKIFCSPSTPKTQTPNPKRQNPKPKTRNPKPETRNPKLETQNPKPETRNPKLFNFHKHLVKIYHHRLPLHKNIFSNNSIMLAQYIGHAALLYRDRF